MRLKRINRAVAMAVAAAALALAASASTALASDPSPVLLDDGAQLSFGNSWGSLPTGGLAATLSGDFTWSPDANGNTTGRLTNGNIYIEDSRAHARIEIDYYPDAFHGSDPPVASREGGEKIGTGVFLNTFPITVGGVNCACTHAHVNLQKKVAGVWTTVDTEYVNL
jgi:hypothetical protein